MSDKSKTKRKLSARQKAAFEAFRAAKKKANGAASFVYNGKTYKKVNGRYEREGKKKSVRKSTKKEEDPEVQRLLNAVLAKWKPGAREELARKTGLQYKPAMGKRKSGRKKSPAKKKKSRKKSREKSPCKDNKIRVPKNSRCRPGPNTKCNKPMHVRRKVPDGKRKGKYDCVRQGGAWAGLEALAGGRKRSRRRSRRR